MKDVLLEIRNVSKSYRIDGNKRHIVFRDLSFCIYSKETIGLLGSNGSGKSTIAKLILGLEKPDQGNIFFNGKNIKTLSGKAKREHFRQVQMVWQDPTAYLNPYQSVLISIMEPMESFNIYPKKVQQNKALELMNILDLPDYLARKKPFQLSAGQCQRVAIARALSVTPKLLICDEALVNLDLPQQVKILRLLKNLQKDWQLSILFISHDHDTVKAICSRTLTINDRALGASVCVPTQSMGTRE